MSNVRTAAPRWGLDLRSLRLQNAGVGYALVIIVLAVTVAADLAGRPSYLSAVNVSNVLDQSAFVGILAVFQTVVLISGNFDLSVGSVAALGGAVSLGLLDDVGLPAAVAIAVGCGVLTGLINGIFVQLVGVNAFIVTLGMLVGVRGVVLIVSDARAVSATSQALADFQSGRWTVPVPVALVLAVALLAVAVVRAVRSLRGGAGTPRGTWAVVVGGVVALLFGTALTGMLTQTKSTWILVALTAVAAAVLRFTVVGRRLYAVGGNTEAARLAGIAVTRYRILSFVLNGAVAAFVGVLYAGKFGAVDPNALTGTELTVIAAAVLGGTALFGGSGSVVKSAVGALILFTLDNGFNILNLGANYHGVVQGVVIIAATAVYTVAARRRRAAKTPAADPPPEAPAPIEANLGVRN